MTGSHNIAHRFPPRSPLPVLDLGLAPYGPLQALQGRLRQAVAEGSLPGVLLLLEHEPVITLGSRGTDDDLRLDVGSDSGPGLQRDPGRVQDRHLALSPLSTEEPKPGHGISSFPAPIPVLRSERGGQATLHAPGQLVSYPVVPVPGRDLGRYVHDLEECLIAVLAGHTINAERRTHHPGLYVGGEKIASVGLRCQRWVASHGTSLNVNIDLTLFESIVSCGEAELRQTSMQSLLDVPPAMSEVKEAYCRAFDDVFGWQLAPMRQVAFSQVEPELGL
jgi:lipoyl(octanoyl) transferase